MNGLNYSDSEPRIHYATGEHVAILRRSHDVQGAYVDIKFLDGRIKRVHPSHVRPLTFLELLEYQIAARKKFSR